MSNYIKVYPLEGGVTTHRDVTNADIREGVLVIDAGGLTHGYPLTSIRKYEAKMTEE